MSKLQAQQDEGGRPCRGPFLASILLQGRVLQSQVRGGDGCGSLRSPLHCSAAVPPPPPAPPVPLHCDAHVSALTLTTCFGAFLFCFVLLYFFAVGQATVSAAGAQVFTDLLTGFITKFGTKLSCFADVSPFLPPFVERDASAEVAGAGAGAGAGASEALSQAVYRVSTPFEPAPSGDKLPPFTFAVPTDQRRALVSFVADLVATTTPPPGESLDTLKQACGEHTAGVSPPAAPPASSVAEPATAAAPSLPTTATGSGAGAGAGAGASTSGSEDGGSSAATGVSPAVAAALKASQASLRRHLCGLKLQRFLGVLSVPSLGVDGARSKVDELVARWRSTLWVNAGAEGGQRVRWLWVVGGWMVKFVVAFCTLGFVCLTCFLLLCFCFFCSCCRCARFC